MNEDSFHLGVKAIIRNNEGKILLLKVNLKQLKNFKGEAYWDIPGGRIQKDSTIEDTLKREVQEETGICTIHKFLPFSMVLSKIRIPIDKDSVGLVLSTCICEVGDINNIKISNEHTEYKWFSSKEAAKLLSFKYPQEFIQKLSELN